MIVDFLLKFIEKNKKIYLLIQRFFVSISDLSKFAFLVGLYISSQFVLRACKFKLTPRPISIFISKKFSSFYSKSVSLFERKNLDSISRIDLIEIAIRNMSAKKTRTFITVGGMSLGIAAIVFLVSVGYGLQNLVISRVARLDELKQADISKNPGSKVNIDDKTISDIKQLQEVKEVLPLISVVGRVEFNNSITDVAVYGVTSDYLKNSAIKPTIGQIFDSNELSVSLEPEKGVVAGAKVERSLPIYGNKISDIDFTIDPGEWVRVRDGPSTESKILGYTKRVEGIQQGVSVWGSEYVSDGEQGKAEKNEKGEYFGRWVKTKVFLWKDAVCEEKNPDCVGGKYLPIKDDEGVQIQKEGYFAEFNANIKSKIESIPAVLGAKTEVLAETSLALETSQSTTSSGLTIKVTDDPNFIEILEESIAAEVQKVIKIDINPSAKKTAVVNKAFLQILGINESDAVGKEFSIAFILTSDLIADMKDKVESNPTLYKIVGVTPDDKVPLMYVPFIDLRSLGIANYSQARVLVRDESSLPKSRLQVESMGFITRSVADTVNQINTFFATARLALAAMGIVALVVASLGLFNTLTVSLLERTREVGLMRAMGMKSSEVQELFLCESIIMGVFGGFIGLVIGFIAGKLLGFLLSAFSIAKGLGFLNVTYIPPAFVLIILVLSVSVGFITGIYPATRAKKISALNALRYE